MSANGLGEGKPFVFQAGSIKLTLDLRAYRLSAVQKTGYRMAAKCTAVLGVVSDPILDVILAFAPSTSEKEAQEVARQFFQELLDQELREKVAEETASLRTLLFAHAFSRTSLPRRDG
jgi:His-Xaa-Ser system protein HxsD